MATVFVDISAALDKHLNDMSGKPPVAFENYGYNPTKGTLYVRPTNLQGDTFAETENDRTNGVYQIDIIAPSGEGKAEVNAMADIIADRFKQDTDISYNGQTVHVKTCSRRGGENAMSRNTGNSGWYILIIEVVYYSFTARR